MRKLIIIRGIAGSGKSYAANSLRQFYFDQGLTPAIYSTDDLFISASGEYKFNPSLLHYNHSLNQWAVFQDCRQHISKVIIIDNTNTTWWEIRPYVLIGLAYEYSIEIHEPETNWRYNAEECFKRNSHGVPLEAIQKMLNRFESSKDLREKIKKLEQLC